MIEPSQDPREILVKGQKAEMMFENFSLHGLLYMKYPLPTFHLSPCDLQVQCHFLGRPQTSYVPVVLYSHNIFVLFLVALIITYYSFNVCFPTSLGHHEDGGRGLVWSLLQYTAFNNPAPGEWWG